MFSLFDLTKNNLMANEIRIYLSVGYVGKPFTTSSVLWKRTLCGCVCVLAMFSCVCSMVSYVLFLFLFFIQSVCEIFVLRQC